MRTLSKPGLLKYTAVTTIISFFLHTGVIFAHEPEDNIPFRVIRGERPPIDLASVTADAIVEGVLLIRFKTEYSDHLEQNPPAQITNEKWHFNLPSVDYLNEMYAVNNVEQYFLSAALNSQFSARHKAWGFHLWYKLEIDPKVNIKDAVRFYEALDEIDIAEPEYKKMLITIVAPETGIEVLSASDILLHLSNDPRFNDQWHYHNTGQAGGTPGADIDLLQAWTIETGNPDVIVAIIDDGIQFSHPDLYGNMWPGIGFNFVAGTSNVVPGSHGTHVAGTIAALSKNGIGVAGIAGGTGNNDGVRLMSAQVFSEFGNGGFHVAPIWAADNGAAISQNSWGYTAPNVYNQNVLDAIDYFNINGGGYALTEGGITIFAAGNSSSSAYYYPAYYSGALSVAATNNKDARSYYSNFGAWIDISAPGGETLSGSFGGVLSTVTNSGYAFYQGTSMACPHVSGVAALVASHAYGQISNDDLKNILLNSTDNHYSSNPNFPGQLGSGRLNAFQALLEAQNYLTGVLNPVGFSAGAFNTTEIILNWSLNPNGDNVLLAWATEQIISTPEPGQHYQVGESIPGGAVVLYYGADTEFLHSGLEPVSKHYYYIWSCDDFHYSSGRPASATTLCPLNELPFFEDFEAGAELPVCWVQSFLTGSIYWLTGSGNGENNPPGSYQGEQNVFFKAQGGNDLGRRTRLSLPQMNLAPFDSVELKFFYTNQMRQSADNEFQDILRVLYKPSENAEWYLLKTFESDIEEWTEVTLKLSGQSSTYFLAFEAESGRGHGICIDNVSVLGYGSIPTFTINSSAKPNGSISPSGSIMVGMNADATFFIQPDIHFVIDSLMVDNIFISEASGLENYSYTFSNVFQNHSIDVSFRLKEYLVAVSINPAEAGTIEGVGSYTYGSEVSLNAVEAEGFIFKRWFENGPVSMDNPYTFNLYSNRQLVALFSPIIHVISASAATPGSGSIQGNGSYFHGHQASLVFVANHGYELDYWTDDGVIVSSENPYVFNVYDSRTLKAHRRLKLWDIEAVAAPANAGSIEGTGIYEHGSTVTLDAIATDNFSFIEWIDNDEVVSVENPYSFVAGNHLLLTARFELKTSAGNIPVENFMVYPNPSSGIFTLELNEPASLRVMDLTGRTLITRHASQGKTHIDLSGEAKGLYFLQLQSQTGIASFKFILN